MDPFDLPTVPVIYKHELKRCCGRCQDGKLPCPVPAVCSEPDDDTAFDALAEIEHDTQPVDLDDRKALADVVVHPGNPRAARMLGLAIIIALLGLLFRSCIAS